MRYPSATLSAVPDKRTYYIFAILFLIFDVEAVFLFPWAVVFLDNNVAFYAMMIFLAVLGFALLYGWRKGVLEWSR